MNEINFFVDKHPSFLKRFFLFISERMLFYLVVVFVYWLGRLQHPPLFYLELIGYVFLIFLFFYSLWAAYEDSIVLLKKIVFKEGCFFLRYEKWNKEIEIKVQSKDFNVNKVTLILPYPYIAGVKFFCKKKLIFEQVVSRFFWPSKNVKKLLSWIESKMNEGD